MIYGYANYVNGRNSVYNYNYNAVRSAYSNANTAEIGAAAGAPRKSYINSDAIKALTDIRNNAEALKDSLGVLTQASAFEKMFAEASKSEDMVVNSGNLYENTHADANRPAAESAIADASSLAGEDNRTQAAQNSVHSVNSGNDKPLQTGDAHSSGKNEPSTAKNASAEPLVSAKKEPQAFSSAVKGMVNSFNALTGSAKSNSRLSGDLKKVHEQYAASLEKVGIKSKPDGTLSIDENKLGKAAENGSLQSLFAKADNNNGFTGRLSQIADNAASKIGYSTAASRSNPQQQPLQSAQKSLDNAYNYSRNNSSSMYDYLFGTSGGSTLGALFNLYA